MKTLCFPLACLLLFATVSCKKSVEYGDVCDGLLQNGTADSAKFIKPGDWVFKYFAYTPNGKDIEYKDVLEPGILRANNTDSLRYYYANEGVFVPTFFSGSNDLKMTGGAHSMLYYAGETPILIALQTAICYSIKDDILYIHFKESAGKNLFILQRK